MSGGAFDYGYYKIQTIIDGIDEHLNETSFEYSEKMLKVFEAHKKELEILQEKTKALEYVASGDYSEETYFEEYEK